MRSRLDQPPVDHADDDVAVSHRRQAMGDDENRAVLHDLPHIALDDPFALIIEGRGRLVEDQDRRIGRKRAGDGDALALAAGEVGPALLDHRVIAQRKLADELVGPGEARRRRSPVPSA